MSNKLYQMEVYPVLLSCNFVVDAANGNGLGIRSLKGAGVQNVFMHTSATPGVGNGGITNPNPASGTIVVQFQDGYNRLLGGMRGVVSPVSGSAVKIDNSALTPGVAYIITTLGDASVAKWQSIGVPKGLTPAVGLPFIASSDGGSANTSTSRVMTTAAAGSNIFSFETVGDSNLALNPVVASQQGFGGQVILQCRNDSSSDAPQIATPADGTVIALSFYLSNSSVSVAGQ
jgi:hypothetical protein